MHDGGGGVCGVARELWRAGRVGPLHAQATMSDCPGGRARRGSTASQPFGWQFLPPASAVVDH